MLSLSTGVGVGLHPFWRNKNELEKQLEHVNRWLLLLGGILTLGHLQTCRSRFEIRNLPVKSQNPRVGVEKHPNMSFSETHLKIIGFEAVILYLFGFELL